MSHLTGKPDFVYAKTKAQISCAVTEQCLNFYYKACKIPPLHFRPVVTRWSGSTSRMRVISESCYANLPSRTRLVAISVVFGGWGKVPIQHVYWLNPGNWWFFTESF